MRGDGILITISMNVSSITSVPDSEEVRWKRGHVEELERHKHGDERYEDDGTMHVDPPTHTHAHCGNATKGRLRGGRGEWVWRSAA